MKDFLHQLLTTRTGTCAVLLLAAFLEAYGDSCFQLGVHRSTGVTRYIALGIGALALALYGLIVNTPPWDFGRLLGTYIVLFFVMVQVLAKVRFQQSPSTSILLGGSLIMAGGAVMTFWR